MKTIDIIVIENILAQLARVGISQKELAKRANLNYEALNKILKKHRPPNKATVEACAAALDIDAETLYARSAVLPKDLPPMSASEAAKHYGPRLSDLARPGYEPPPAPKTFTPEEVKAFLKEELSENERLRTELLEVGRLRAELDRVRAEAEEIKAQSAGDRKKIERLIEMYEEAGLEVLLSVPERVTAAMVLQSIDPDHRHSVLGRPKEALSEPRIKSRVSNQGKKS